MKKRNKVLVVMTMIAVICAGVFMDEANAAGLPDYLTIGLRYGSSAVSSGLVTSEDSLLLGELNDNVIIAVSDLGGHTSVGFQCDNNKITLTSPDGTNLAEISQDAVYIIYPLRYDEASPISYGGDAYRGGIILKPSGGKAAVLNYLKTEQYLEGMLHAEMPQSSPVEALKAQAVAARNFAFVKQNLHQADGFNLCASNHCQVYAGVSGEYDRTSKAVRETEGLMMYSDGAVVEAYYSKNAGGYTNNSEDVWAAALPYLRGVRDAGEPVYPWTASFGIGDFGAKMQSAGFSVGSVQKIQIKSRSISGSVLELEVSGTGGTALLKKEQIRSVLGTSAVKSLKFNFSGLTQTVPVSERVMLSLSGAQNSAAVANEVYVMDQNGVNAKVSLSDLILFNGSEKSKLGGEPSQPSGTETADISSGTVTFTGSGYGHGVGMSQDGAMEMAAKGKSFEEILQFYYTGVEIY